MDTLLVGPEGEAATLTAQHLEALGARVLRVLAPSLPPPTGLSLVVLLEPPDGDLGWCRQLCGSAPLLVVTPREETGYLEALLEAGASDFLVWPREAPQLRPRLLATARRPASQAARVPLRQEDMETLLRVYPGLVFLLSADGTLLRAPANEQRGYFRPPQEFLGRHLSEVLPQSATRPILEALARCVRTGMLEQVHYRLPTPSGAGTYQATLCPAASGRVLALVDDVTERMQAQEALRESEEQYRTLFSLGLDAISITDMATGRFVAVNDAWVRLYGWSREEAVGRMGPHDVSAEPESTQATLEQAVATGAMCRLVRPNRTRDGRTFRAEVNAQPLVLRGRTVIVAVLRDVTEREQLEAQVRLADRMASVGTLAAGVAHELNNPLTFVLGNLELLASGRTLAEEARRELLVEALEGARRMSAIVNDLKTFSRPDESQARAVDVREVLDASLRLLTNELRYRARLVRDFEEVPPARATPSRLGQVFVNLLTNALQAMPEARPPEQNEVVVAVRAAGRDAVAVEVRDNGQGMTPEVQRRIFDPFFTTKPVGVGTGLGLAICQGIVTGLGGRLEVESAPVQGSVFRVVLPRAPAEAPVLPPARAPEAPSGAPLRVLLVDDERNLAFTLAVQLAPEVQLVAVTSGAEGLARIRAGERFDAVVCDLMMPAMSGMDFHAALAREDAALAARTGFITGGAFTARAQAFTHEVAGRVLEKPFRAEELRALVQTLARSPSSAPT